MNLWDVVIFFLNQHGNQKACLSFINRNIAEGMLFKKRYFKLLVYKLNEKENEVIYMYERNVLLF